MDNLKTVEGKVKAVLQKNEDARNDDMVLYLALCNLYLKNAGTMPLAEIMTRHKELSLPSFRERGQATPQVAGEIPRTAWQHKKFGGLEPQGKRHTVRICPKNREVDDAGNVF